MLERGLVESIEDHSHGIYNFFSSDEGLNCHRSYGYLVNPAVGSIIADGGSTVDAVPNRQEPKVWLRCCAFD